MCGNWYILGRIRRTRSALWNAEDGKIQFSDAPVDNLLLFGNILIQVSVRWNGITEHKLATWIIDFEHVVPGILLMVWVYRRIKTFRYPVLCHSSKCMWPTATSRCHGRRLFVTRNIDVILVYRKMSKCRLGFTQGSPFTVSTRKRRQHLKLYLPIKYAQFCTCLDLWDFIKHCRFTNFC